MGLTVKNRVCPCCATPIKTKNVILQYSELCDFWFIYYFCHRCKESPVLSDDIDFKILYPPSDQVLEN
jgi:hypothetical protein